MMSRWRRRVFGKDRRPPSSPALNASCGTGTTTAGSILPTTVTPSSTAFTSSRNPYYKSPKPGSINCIPRYNHNLHVNYMMSPNAVGCTNFLMGGQYYPGKDKNRLYLRRKTLWYRIFWSSPFRKGLSVLVLLYLILVYVLNPTLNLLLHYGKILSTRSPPTLNDTPNGEDGVTIRGDVPIHDIDEVPVEHRDILKRLKPLHMAREDAQKIMQKLHDIKEEKFNVENRRKVLKKLIPEWFRKDDAAFSSSEEETNDEEPFVSVRVQERNKATKKDVFVVVEQEHVPRDDANNFRKKNADNVPIPLHKEEDKVVDFTNRLGPTLRTLQNKRDHYKNFKCPRDVNDISITLVVQSTLDRLPLMTVTCQRWKGPIITVVYLTVDESSTVWDSVVYEYSASCPHLKLIPYIGKSRDERKLEYPINKLRNLGLDNVVTSYVLVLDIDLIPSTGLDEALISAITLAIEAREDDDGNRGLDPKDAIIVPAFERKPPTLCHSLQDCLDMSLQQHDSDFIPRSMEGLRRCVRDEQCIVFQSDVNWEGHYDTKSLQWLDRNNTDSLDVLECFHSQRYEPYVAIPWCPLEKNARQRLAVHAPCSPYYDERFHGYGKNKIQQIAHLREKGYKFSVMPATGFVVHHPHPESVTKETWNNKSDYNLHQNMDRLYPQYLDEIYNEYGGSFVETKLC